MATFAITYATRMAHEKRWTKAPHAVRIQDKAETFARWRFNWIFRECFGLEIDYRITRIERIEP